MRASFVIASLALILCCRDASRSAPVPTPAPSAAAAPVAPSPGATKDADDLCGLEDFPVSRSSSEILALVPRAERPSSTMLANLRVDGEGRVTHIRVVKIAYPEAPALSRRLNVKALDDLKKRRFSPPTVAGGRLARCFDVSVTIDLK